MPLHVNQIGPTPCNCDRFGVVHVRTPECDLDYDGPPKPEPQSIYGPDPILTAINDLFRRVSIIEEKIVKLEGENNGL